jgi:hypothetical protein
MSEYERKQAEKRARYEARAEKSRRECAEKLQSARQASGAIPMGQPILVGHHSEKRHRRDLGRINGAYDAAHAAQEKAEHYERKAARIGSGGISADDPNAVAKLGEKLARMETQREEIKAENKRRRKAGEESAPAYVLQNLGANIRRVRERIKELETKAARAVYEPIECDGFTIEECPHDNRLRFMFDDKPPSEVRAIMKAQGFRWAPSVGAWQRQLTENARMSASVAQRRIGDFYKGDL